MYWKIRDCPKLATEVSVPVNDTERTVFHILETVTPSHQQNTHNTIPQSNRHHSLQHQSTNVSHGWNFGSSQPRDQ